MSLISYVAFLRAINAGAGRAVKMQALTEVFESLGFTSVSTLGASGNLLFQAAASDPSPLETRIESGLAQALGLHSDAFVRTSTELDQITRCIPFAGLSVEPPAEIEVVFLKDPLEAAVGSRLEALTTSSDEYRSLGREIYWLRRHLPGAGPYSTLPLEKTLRRPFTVRHLRVLHRLLKEFAAEK